MRYGYFIDHNKSIIDEIMAVYMPEKKSYTGKNQVEIFCHGGRHIVKLIQDELIKTGARVAEPGEFTKIAFLSGRIDLTKAEAVAEVIASNTLSSHKAALEHLTGAYGEHVLVLREQLVDIIADVEASIDYPEEEITPIEKQKMLQQIKTLIEQIKILASSYTGGRIIKEGFKIAIGGRPNAGKSSLFNLLLKQERALVTATPGTTRDYLSEWIDLDGYKVNIIDTAGLRKSGGVIEKEGQKSARKIIDSSDLLLWLIDISQKDWQKKLAEDVKDMSGSHKIMIRNKIDLHTKSRNDKLKVDDNQILKISCKNGEGVDNLKQIITRSIKSSMPDLTSGIIVTSARHRQKLDKAVQYLKIANQLVKDDESPELIAFELRAAINAIDEITGKIYNEDILGKIFSKFCIGK